MRAGQFVCDRCQLTKDRHERGHVSTQGVLCMECVEAVCNSALVGNQSQAGMTGEGHTLLLAPAKAAALLGISRRKFDQLYFAGLVPEPAVDDGQRFRRWHRKDLLDWRNCAGAS